MNEDEITLIRKAFNDNREIIEETPPEIRSVDKKFYQGGSVYTTVDGEFIDLEIQKRDYDIEDHVNYIEFAEKAVGVPFTMISNGPKREDIIYR